MVPGLLIGGLGLEALGIYGQGQAASANAKAQATVAEYNAKVAEQQSKSTEQAVGYQERRAAEAAQREQGQLTAELGAAGVVPSQGTPLMLQAKQASEAELNNLMMGYEGMNDSSRAMSAAALSRLQGSMYNQQAGNASLAGLIGAGSSLLTGFGRYYAAGYGG